MNKTVLVVGSTGMMGRQIARELVARGATVRALVRPGKTKEVGELRGDGATPAEGDLFDPASLAAACAGVGVVVSALQGMRQIVVDGQTNLLRAAEAAGVGRMIPSDYCVDLFKLKAGENRNLDLRREFDSRLDASGVRGTSVLNGAFAEMVFRGFAGAGEDDSFGYWGDGEQPCDFTTTADTAAFTAAAALDPDAPRALRVAGAVVTMNQLHAILEEATGRRLAKKQLGSVEDLERKIAVEKEAFRGSEDDPFPVYQQLQYLHNMVSGRAKLDPLDNTRYPGVSFESLAAFLRRAGKKPV